MTHNITKVIAILLIICTISIMLFSCTSNDIQKTTDTDSQTNESVSDTNDTVKETDAEGTITLFKNGAYVARVIRGAFPPLSAQAAAYLPFSPG